MVLLFFLAIVISFGFFFNHHLLGLGIVERFFGIPHVLNTEDALTEQGILLIGEAVLFGERVKGINEGVNDICGINLFFFNFIHNESFCCSSIIN